MFRLVTLVVAIGLFCFPAQAQQRADSGAEARASAFGTGPDVRWQPLIAAYMFGQPTFESIGDPSTGVIQDGVVRRPGMPISAPVENGPCRLFMHQAAPASNDVGLFSFLCRPDQALPYVFVSFERRKNFSPSTLAMQLAQGDQASLGLTPATCAESRPPPGLERITFCESTFEFGQVAGSGRALSVVGSVPGFFFRATTACAGAQCEGAVVAFREFVARLRFN